MDDLTKLEASFERHRQEDYDTREAIVQRLDSIDKKLDPIADAYKGILFSKSFVAGVGTLIVGIMGIGAAVLWLLGQIGKH